MQSKKEGQLSEYYRELIEDWQAAITPMYDGTFISYAQDYHTGPAWLEVRDEIKAAGIENLPEVVEVDKALIKKVLKEKVGGNYESKLHPLEHWWWHLEKIADRTYPAELLPEHLRKFYLSNF
ncbi:MAG: hypothetical protein ABDH18_05330 [Aquificaceae bacterium]